VEGVPVATEHAALLVVPQWTATVGRGVPEGEGGLVACAVDDGVDVVQVRVVVKDDPSGGGDVFPDDGLPFDALRGFGAVPAGGGASGLVDGELGGRDKLVGYVMSRGRVSDDKDLFGCVGGGGAVGFGVDDAVWKGRDVFLEAFDVGDLER